ncbi:MAG: hypothetical protein WC242_04020 [Candidatus Paceibacterota bacterium]|jgi:hypothetical protein
MLGRIVKFPDDFEILPKFKNGNLPRLIASSLPYYVRLLARIFPEEWRYQKIEVDGHVFHLAFDTKWEIHSEPEHSPSAESMAEYHARVDGVPGFLLGSLGCNSHTSNHWHKLGGEHYFLIAGKGEVCCVNRPQKLTVPGRSQAYVGTAGGPKGFHPVLTTDQSLLVVILMEQGLDRSDHHYL